MGGHNFDIAVRLKLLVGILHNNVCARRALLNNAWGGSAAEAILRQDVSGHILDTGRPVPARKARARMACRGDRVRGAYVRLSAVHQALVLV